MLARFAVFAGLDHKIKISKDYLADAIIADCCIRIMVLTLTIPIPNWKSKAMAAINYVNDRTGVANTLDKSLYPQLQLVKDVGKFYYWLLYLFSFLCHFIVNV